VWSGWVFEVSDRVLFDRLRFLVCFSWHDRLAQELCSLFPCCMICAFSCVSCGEGFNLGGVVILFWFGVSVSRRVSLMWMSLDVSGFFFFLPLKGVSTLSVLFRAI